MPSPRTHSSPLVAFIASWIVAPTRTQKLLVVLVFTFLVANLFWHGAQPYAVGLFNAPWDKLAHLVVYGGFASLLWVLASPHGTTWAVLGCAVLGVADEVAQGYSPGRHMSMGDWATDVCAAVLAALVLDTLRRRLSQPGSATLRASEADRPITP